LRFVVFVGLLGFIEFVGFVEFLVFVGFVGSARNNLWVRSEISISCA